VVLRPTVLARLGDLEGSRTRVQLDAISPWVEKAVLAMEDARFRDHAGVDPLGVARALWVGIRGDGRAQGGSTLTQQLAKNLFLSQERTARRKVREVFFATALESRLSKDEILSLYLGEVYLGQVGSVPVHGVEQASRAWFGVAASRLTLAQAATIAGVISAPNAYSPLRHPEVAVERRDLALQRMQELGWATPEAVAAARAEPLAITGLVTGPARRAPWTVDAALEVAEGALGPGELTRAGYRVYTTIQPHLQVAAERAVSEGLAEVAADRPASNDAQAALVVVRASDGAVVALVGSRSYRESPFDRAADAWREVGSTVKPLTLLAALDANPDLHPASIVVDEPISRRVDGKVWTPHNADGAWRGPMTLRVALEQSRNIPAIKLAEEVGPHRLQGAFRDAGLSRATHLPSAALGAFPATPLQLAAAYTVFPGGGARARPRMVSSIVDANGAEVVAFNPDIATLASERAAAQVTRLLQGVLSDGTGKKAGTYGVGGAVGGKTGTTDEGRDAWVAGVTPEYAVVAWVGRDRGTPLGLSGSQAALPVWARMIADGGVAGGAFPLPNNLVSVPICRESGRAARDACPVTVPDLFPKGHEPGGSCDVHGGPLVEAGRWLRNVFGVRRREDVEGAEVSPP
jgi:penicillin-binding protein 1B